MDTPVEIYQRELVPERAKRVLSALVVAAALVLGLWSVPAHAADGVVTGTVTDAEGNPLADVEVAVLWLHQTANPHYDEIGFAQTNATGDYAIDAPPGTLRVYFFGDDVHAGEWYDDAAAFADATDLALASDGTVSADAALAEYGHVDGHVDLAAGDPRTQAVALLDPATGAVQARANIDENGDYVFSAVRPGSYKVSFNRLSGFALSAAEFWDSAPEHDGVAGADLVTVTAGGEVSGVDATLVEGGHITGSLVDDAGNPLACRVQAFTLDRSLVTRSVTSGPSGTFDISGLTTGSYLVRVVPSGPCRAGTQYRTAGGGPLSGSLGAAQPVAVTLGGGASAGAALVYQMPTVTNTGLPGVFFEPMPGTPFYDHPVVGVPLGAAVGGWTPDPTSYSYAWLADGVPIPGATLRTYVPVAADVGKLISVRVRAFRSGFRAGTADSPAFGPVTAPPITNLALPSIPGVVRVGRYSRAGSGSWSVPDATYTYTWMTGSTILHTSADPRYLVPALARAHGLTVTVTASKPGYGSGSSTSVAVPVQLGIFRKMKMLTVRGEARVGETLKAATKVSPKPEKAVYVWKRDGQVIAGARRKRYTLGEADLGHRITVTVRYSSPGFTTLELTSKHTAPVHR